MFTNLKKLFLKEPKIMIIGAGSLGLALSAFFTLANKNVITIAKEKKYQRIKKQKGIKLISELLPKTKEVFVKLNIKNLNHSEKVDYIFICTRTSAFESVIPIIKRCAKKNTLIIPLSDGFGVTDYLKKQLPSCKITTSQAYGLFYRDESGEIIKVRQFSTCGGFFLGASTYEEAEEQEKELEKLNKIVQNIPLQVNIYHPRQVLYESYKKHCLNSSFDITALVYDKTMSEILEDEKATETMHLLLKDLVNLGNKLGIINNENFYNEVLEDYKFIAPDRGSSAANDIKANVTPELYFQFFDVLNKAKSLQLELPEYERIAPKLKHLTHINC